MGFVEWYIIVWFSVNLLSFGYTLGGGDLNTDEITNEYRLIFRWITMLPLIGRVFGWW